MKLLLDSCMAPGTAHALRAVGHDVVWVGEWDEDPGDEDILARALAEGRVLVTLDKDFGELAIVFGRAHSGILRVVNFRAGRQAPVIEQVLALHAAELEQSAIVTVEPGRIRVRPAGPPADNGGSTGDGP
jgi:predicted nuclease of predicted toxin-antitoxin system